jgi:hypothetical protein
MKKCGEVEEDVSESITDKAIDCTAHSEWKEGENISIRYPVVVEPPILISKHSKKRHPYHS